MADDGSPRVKFSVSVDRVVYDEIVRVARLAERSVSAEAAVRLRASVVLRGDAPALVDRGPALAEPDKTVGVHAGSYPDRPGSASAEQPSVSAIFERMRTGDLVKEPRPDPKGKRG